MSKDFYRAFEERFRGSRDLIKSRLQVYMPFVLPLCAVFPDAVAVDLGCGRGEWLELLRQYDVRAKGVDLDSGMLSACSEAGLDAVQGDILEYLRGLEDGTCSVVSAFHVVEHVSFDYLQELISNALRVLVPGGLVILETPNPENFEVGTHTFYLDPTHARPIPPQFLSFLPEYSGFARVGTLRLNGPLDTDSTKPIELSDVLLRASPDYGVVAQKAGSPGTMALLDAVFSFEHGVSSRDLIDSFDRDYGKVRSNMRSVDLRLGGVEQCLSQVSQDVVVIRRLQELHVLQAEQRASSAELRAFKAEKHAEEVERHASHLNEVIAERDADAFRKSLEVQYWHERLLAVHGSTSWKVTKPLRLLKRLVSGERGPEDVSAIGSCFFKVRHGARTVLAHAIRFVFQRPTFRAHLSFCLKRVPWLYARLLKVGFNTGAVGNGRQDASAQESVIEYCGEMPPRAREIFARIKSQANNRNAK